MLLGSMEKNKSSFQQQRHLCIASAQKETKMAKQIALSEPPFKNNFTFQLPFIRKDNDELINGTAFKENICIEPNLR